MRESFGHSLAGPEGGAGRRVRRTVRAGRGRRPCGDRRCRGNGSRSGRRENSSEVARTRTRGACNLECPIALFPCRGISEWSPEGWLSYGVPYPARDPKGRFSANAWSLTCPERRGGAYPLGQFRAATLVAPGPGRSFGGLQASKAGIGLGPARRSRAARPCTFDLRQRP